MTSARAQLAEAITEAIEPHGTTSTGVVTAVLDALAVRPRTLREFADNPTPPARWTSAEDPARWLRGACSSGDPLHPAVTAVLGELAWLRAIEAAATAYKQVRDADPDGAEWYALEILLNPPPASARRTATEARR